MKASDHINQKTFAITHRNSLAETWGGMPSLHNHFELLSLSFWFFVALVIGVNIFGREAESTEMKPVSANTPVLTLDQAITTGVSQPAPSSLPQSRIRTADVMEGEKPDGVTSARDIVVTQIGDHVFHIPKGYISSFLGYAGYVQIRALLPCLDPETAGNTAEFHRNDPGRILIATLNAWDSHYLAGEQLFRTHIANSQSMKDRYPEYRQIDIGPTVVPGTNFLAYKDILLQRDLFVLNGSDPFFFVDCNMHSKMLPFPTCSLREHIWEDVRLYYWYSRSFIDQDTNNSTEIDGRLLRLLSSFLTDPLQHEQSYKGETCK